jgi:hypothetical protein
MHAIYMDWQTSHKWIVYTSPLTRKSSTDGACISGGIRGVRGENQNFSVQLVSVYELKCSPIEKGAKLRVCYLFGLPSKILCLLCPNPSGKGLGVQA